MNRKVIRSVMVWRSVVSPRFVLMCAAIVTLSCGSKTALRDPASTPSDSGRIDVPTDSPSPCARWRFGATILISTGILDAQHRTNGAVPVAGGALVGWTISSAPSRAMTRVVRFVNEDATRLGELNTAIRGTPMSMSVGSFVFAARQGSVGALSWDNSAGCAFVRLGPDGVPETLQHRVFDSTCGGLQATSAGFSLLHEDPETLSGTNGLVDIDALGVLAPGVGTRLIPVTVDASVVSRARIDESSFLLGWRQRVNDVPSFFVQSFNDDGSPRAPAPVSLGSDFVNTNVVSAFGEAMPVLRQLDPSGSERLRFQRLTPTGTLVGGLTTIARVGDQRTTASSFAQYQGRTWILWGEAPASGMGQLNIAALNEDGSVGEVFNIESGRSGSTYLQVSSVATSVGALIVFVRQDGTEFPMIYARAAYCDS